jgi:hypothetical protein
MAGGEREKIKRSLARKARSEGTEKGGINREKLEKAGERPGKVREGQGKVRESPGKGQGKSGESPGKGRGKSGERSGEVRGKAGERQGKGKGTEGDEKPRNIQAGAGGGEQPQTPISSAPSRTPAYLEGLHHFLAGASGRPPGWRGFSAVAGPSRELPARRSPEPTVLPRFPEFPKSPR